MNIIGRLLGFGNAKTSTVSSEVSSKVSKHLSGNVIRIWEISGNLEKKLEELDKTYSLAITLYTKQSTIPHSKNKVNITPKDSLNLFSEYSQSIKNLDVTITELVTLSKMVLDNEKELDSESREIVAKATKLINKFNTLKERPVYL
ncbi:MAG: hypothetical protein ACP5N1_01545 [Candidatus Woesearchaeota archaeon]